MQQGTVTLPLSEYDEILSLRKFRAEQNSVLFYYGSSPIQVFSKDDAFLILEREQRKKIEIFQEEIKILQNKILLLKSHSKKQSFIKKVWTKIKNL